MRYAFAAAALAGVASAAVQQGWSSVSAAPNGTSTAGGDVYVTEVVTAFTTYCPEATALTHNGQTYSVTSATTLTITNCPCTVTKPASSSTSPVAPVSTSPVSTSPAAPAKTSVYSSPVAPVSYSSSTPAAPVSASSTPSVIPYPKTNGTTTTPYSSGAAAGTGSKPSSTAAPYTGGAASTAASAGAAFLALFGLVAAL